jgi:hypothetical protein
MTNNFCVNCEPLFSEMQVLHHKKVLTYQRDWFVLKVENNKLRDEISDLKELLKMHRDAKIQLEAMQ